MAANPVRPLGTDARRQPAGSFRSCPPGNRPYYCFAVAGLARNAASYMPAGLDYCALAPTLITTGTRAGQLRAVRATGHHRRWESRRPSTAAG